MKEKIKDIQTFKSLKKTKNLLKEGKVIEAIDLCIAEAEEAKGLAQKTIEKIKKNQEEMNEKVKKVLAKYP